MKRLRKKGLAIVLGCVVVFAMAACGSQNVGSEEEVQTPVTDEVHTEAPEVTDEGSIENVEPSGTVSKEEEFLYEEVDGNIVITGYEGEANVIMIPETLGGKTVVEIGENAFAGNNNIVEVTIPDSITVIENGAFDACGSMTTVHFGNNLEVIGAAAFYQTCLEEVNMPDTVSVIGADAFGSTDITEIVIPPLVTDIGNGAFAVTKLEEVTIPGTVKNIGNRAFQHCDNLKVVVVEEGTEVIEEFAFESCKTLESITLPSSVTEIGEGIAYSEVKTYIYVPAGSVAESILKEEFAGCENWLEVVAQ